MPELPKIVLERLRVGTPESGHPDADLLSVFAEQGLSLTEREHVLQHLADCEECRDVVALALPPSESVPVSTSAADERQTVIENARQTEKTTRWYEWAGLRWAAVAVGVVVVASVLIVKPGEQKHAMVAKESQPVASQVPQATNEKLAVRLPAEDTLASKTPPASAGRSESRPQVENKIRADARTFADARTLKKQVGSLQDTAPHQPEIASAEQTAVLKRNGTVQDLPANGRNVTQLAALAPGASSTAATPVAVPGRVNPNVDLKTEDQSSDRGSSSANTLVARNTVAAEAEAAPVQRAKTPIDDTAAKAKVVFKGQKQAVGAMTNSAYDSAENAPEGSNWQLSEGMLQRSLDAGQSWQTVLRTDHPFLCHAASGNDVWVGGQAGTLFHSTNGGGTWTQLHPSTKEIQLTADITSIATGKPGTVTLVTRTGESWTTVDNGKTWEKK